MSTAHTPDRPEDGRDDDPQDRAPEHGHAPGHAQDDRAGYKTDADAGSAFGTATTLILSCGVLQLASVSSGRLNVAK